MKVCKCCNQSKELTEFQYRDRSATGKGKYYEGTCISCKISSLSKYTSNISPEYKRKKNIRKSAKLRGKSFMLDSETTDKLIHSKCHYCGETDPSGLVGIDRIDNDFGYLPGNVVPCCTRCNQVRHTYFTVDQMIQLVKYIKSNGWW